jgi:hypothetical protein
VDARDACDVMLGLGLGHRGMGNGEYGYGREGATGARATGRGAGSVHRSEGVKTDVLSAA